MAFIDWTDDMSVGIKQFNDDHKDLIKFLNDLHAGLISKVGISQMSYILDGLIDYTVKHFKNEERYMVKYSYPQYEKHRAEHEGLLRKVEEFKGRLESGETSFSVELMGFLKKWLVEHIQGSDMEYKEFFKQFAKKK